MVLLPNLVRKGVRSVAGGLVGAHSALMGRLRVCGTVTPFCPIAVSSELLFSPSFASVFVLTVLVFRTGLVD